jgi:hypothetical protein
MINKGLKTKEFYLRNAVFFSRLCKIWQNVSSLSFRFPAKFQIGAKFVVFLKVSPTPIVNLLNVVVLFACLYYFSFVLTV